MRSSKTPPKTPQKAKKSQNSTKKRERSRQVSDWIGASLFFPQRPLGKGAKKYHAPRATGRIF
jgi:hypothetical protein